MSIRKALFKQLEALPADTEGWIAASTSEIAESMGKNPVTISKNLASLSQHGNVELRKDDGKVVAVRILRKPRAYASDPSERPSKRERSTPTRRRVFGDSMPTPNVDEYARAKETFESVVPKLGEYVHAEWREIPLAEEALALKRHNNALLDQIKELRQAHDTLKREASYLRSVQNADLRKGLKDAGVLVEHGS